MKKSYAIFAAVGLVTSIGGMARAAYLETFDNNNATWNYGYGANYSTITPATWSAAGGNADGHVSGDVNNLYAVWTYVTAPYSDMTGLSLTIDTKSTDTGSGTAQLYVGRGGAYFIDGVWSIAADTNWTTHAVPLDSTHFSQWTGVDTGAFTLAQVLQAPDDIGIFFGGSLASGSGQLLVDNFGTVAAPEPASLCLLGLGAAALAGRRRKA